MNVEVKLYAVARQLAGAQTVSVSMDQQATVGQLRSALVEQVPELAGVISQCMIAVDMEYADDDLPVPDGAELACIPPVSGG